MYSIIIVYYNIEQFVSLTILAFGYNKKQKIL